MGNCLSICAKRSESAVQDLEVPATGLDSNPQDVQEDVVKELVQQELLALQSQISHSQAVLAKLHFRFNDDAVSESKGEELAKVHRTTQTSNVETQPRSLESVPVGVDKDWQQIASSCPAIVNTAVQTDDVSDTTSKSNGTSSEYFLPPISPVEFQISEPTSPKSRDENSKTFEQRPVGPDLDIYRSCRKLSVLPEEEAMGEEFSPPSQGNRLAPTHFPHHQAHSFESYLLPVATSPAPSLVQRQLSDPTPSPRVHPASRRTSRSTCRPLQLQSDSNYFCFPEVHSDSPKRQSSVPRSPPCVTFQEASDFSEDNFLPRITSPTYNILQDTVSQLITISSETLDTQQVGSSSLSKKESLSIPGYYAFTPDGSSPYKTPPENSLISTPGFYTPQEVFGKLPDSTTSSAFQTPTSISPGANQGGSNKSTSNSSNSFKTPPYNASLEGSSLQSSLNSPLYMSPLPNKRTSTNANNENTFTDVSDLNHPNKKSQLYVKPLQDSFDCNRPMLSILLDETRVQNDNTRVDIEEVKMPFISFTSLDIYKPPPAHSLSDQVPSSSLSSQDSTTLSPVTEGLARTPSRRRLQRSLVRISSETPLELVPVKPSVTSPNADVSAAVIVQETELQENVVDGAVNNMASEIEDGLKMRHTNSDNGPGGLGSTTNLLTSHSFPSLSDTVLKQLGALMEEVKHKEENQSSEKDIESKFTSLMLAFKTDKLTLDRRLELQLRLRDQAEQNMAAELNKLKAAVQLLSPLCTDSEKIELLEKVSEQVDALHKSTSRVSTSTEMYGAVQQENRLSKAVDIILRHVENLKQAYDKERVEHEETRKILTDNKISPNSVLKLQSSKRRASIATLTRAQTPPDPSRSPVLAGEGRGMSRARLGSLPRKLSNTILETDFEETSPTKELTTNGTGSSQLREMVEAVNNVVQVPTRTLQRKPSRPTVTEERRGSQTGETESEDESTPLQQLRETEPPPPADNRSTLLTTRRMSLQVAWMKKLSEHLEWVQPMDQLLKHLRYCVAVVLLIAALAVFTSTFILPHTRLGR